MKKFFKIIILLDFTDFGIMFRIYKNSNLVDYHISIDIQIAFVNIWIQLLKKINVKNKRKIK